MKKFLWVIIALAVIAVIGTNIYQDQKQRADKFVVAVNLPLSGVFSPAFKGGLFAFTSGIQDELKAQNLPEDKIFIDVGDNRLNTTEAITLFNKHEKSGFDVYYVGGADNINAVLPKLNQSGKPAFFLSNSEKNFASGNKDSIRLFPHLSIEAPLYYQFIAGRQARNILFLGSDIMIANEEYNDFIKPYCQKNGLNCQSEFFIPTEKDFRTLALKVKEKNPDVIFMYASTDALYQLIKEFRAYEIDLGKVLICPLFYEVAINPEFPVEVKKDVLFIVSDFLTTKAMAENNFEKQPWVQSFLKEFDRLPMNEDVWYYESGRILARAYAKHGKNVTAQNIVDETPYTGVSCEIKMDKVKKDLIADYVLAKVNDQGEIVEVDLKDKEN